MKLTAQQLSGFEQTDCTSAIAIVEGPIASLRRVSSAREVLHQRAVRQYLFSSFVGSIGLNLMVTVMFKQAYDITGDELTIGLLGLAQFVPSILLVIVSGWASDRFDRRRVTALFLIGRVLCSFALVAYTVAGQTALLPLLAIATVFGAVDAMVASGGDGHDAGIESERCAPSHCGAGERLGEIRDTHEPVARDQQAPGGAGSGQWLE